MVTTVLEEPTSRRGVPNSLRADNGPECAGRMLDLWASRSHAVVDFSRPGQPTDNAFIEPFHGRLRDECLNQHWFLCLDEVKDRTERWRVEYNRERPHGALGNLAREVFASQQAGVKQSSRG
jgi:putative transposase